MILSLLILIFLAIITVISKVKITKISKSFAYAKILELVKASKYRVKPFCPMHNVCGSCQIQFIDYDFQLECKKNIVQETLSNVANLNIDTLDCGVALLNMHAPFEISAKADVYMAYKGYSAFFNS